MSEEVEEGTIVRTLSLCEYESKDIIDTSDPENLDAPPTLAFVVRRATWQEKVKYVIRQKTKLSPGEDLDKKALREWFKEPEIYLCIENDEVTMIHKRYIVSLAHRNKQEEASTEPG
jgi:hypothetical protein